ncbi:MAG: hypothetical protein COA44_03810 [Arcobacter sp.]|nr:MAG: hypothetical protein COA44_03810 [Arcobacter sp.]
MFSSCGGASDSSTFTGVVANVNVNGEVRDFSTQTLLADVKISVSPSSSASITSDINGFYQTTLNSQTDYILTFSKGSYISTEYKVHIDTEGTKVLEAVYLLASNTGTVSGASGTITSTSTSFPLEDVNVSLRQGVSNQTGVVTALTKTLADGSYDFNSISIGTYTIEMALTSYLTGYGTLYVIGGNPGVDQNFSISPEVLSLDGNNSASGTIKDAVTSLGLNDVNISVRLGKNNTTGPIVLTSTSENNGSVDGAYAFNNIAVGIYTLEMSLNGYITGHGNMNVIDGQLGNNQNFVLSPELATNEEMRLILTWKAEPKDLDSNLRGTRDDNTTYKISFSNKIEVGEASLDADATSGFGPETITIENISLGKYVYYHKKFSGVGDLNSSEASVQIIRKGLPIEVIDINTTGSGSFWEVFRIDNNVTTIINKIVISEPVL